MHQNSPFPDQKPKKISGERALPPPQTPPTVGRGHPLPTPYLSRRLRRLEPRAFGARPSPSAFFLIRALSLSLSGIISKRLNVSSYFLRHVVAQLFSFLPRDAIASSAALALMRCPSVHLSVTFVHSVKTYKDQSFSPSGSQAILVFPY